MKLKIGGWQNLRGFKTLDIDPFVHPDYLASIEHIPLKDNSCSEIICDSVLEHIGDMDIAFKEMLRVCAKGGIITIVMPHFSSMGLWHDLQHKRGASYFMFDRTNYTNQDFEVIEKHIFIEGKSLFSGENKNTRWHYIFDFFEGIANRYPRLYEYWLCNIIRADSVYFKLVKL